MATLPIHTIPNQYTELPNSIAASNEGKLCAAWRGQSNNFIYLGFNTDQGVPNWQWNGITTIPDVSTEFAPAITYFGERLFIAWINNNQQVCYTFSDDSGSSFGYIVTLDNTKSKGAPCLSGGSSLFISYTGTDSQIHVMSVG